MSTISSGTTLTTALVQTGDTTGDLVIQTNNGNTTAVTFNTAGAIGVGSSPSYGSVGQYLQSAGNAAPATWATVASSQWTSNSTAIYYNTGNVGIGTTSPNDTLEVAGTDAFIRVNRTGNEPGITFRYSNSSTNRGDIAVTSGGDMYFTAGGSTERMRISSSGNMQLSTAGTSILNSSGRKILNQTGSILQVVSRTITDQEAYSLSNTYQQSTIFDTSITPSSTSSKVLVTISVMFGDGGSTAYAGFRLTKNGSEITEARGVTNGSRKLLTGSGGSNGGTGNSFVQNITIQYLDSPATTSSVTYGIQVTGFSGRTFYINITGNSDGNAGVAAVSSLTLMEIAA